MMKIRCEYTRLVPVSELKPHPKNPKKHTKEAIERQALVMDYQGWRRPITVSNRSGFMTAGHKRLYAAKLRKEKEVPVSFQDYESEEQEIADLAADNALNEWELTDLAAINQLVGDLGPDFNIDLLGIKDFVLDPSEKDAGEDAETEEETAEPPIPALPLVPNVKLGEIFVLSPHTVRCMDSLQAMKLMAESSIDSMVTDPPAGISFMGKEWDDDKGGRDKWIAWLTDMMREALRVMKPGAHGFVWAIPRTSHWTGEALEGAGFEIRDVVTHLFGSGFPKSLDISKAIDKSAGFWRGRAGEVTIESQLSKGKEYERTEKGDPITASASAWDGWGTALKPAAEFWFLIRKPLSEKTVAENVLKWGTGGINVDGCRIGLEKRFNPPTHKAATAAMGDFSMCDGEGSRVTGRFPANLVLDDQAAEMLDAQSGDLGKSSGGNSTNIGGFVTANADKDKIGKPCGFGDSGGASRFFMVFKSSCGPEKTEDADTFVGKKTENKSDVLSTDGSGNKPEGLFQTDTISITKMGTLSIMTLPILSASTLKSIGAITIELEKIIKPSKASSIESVSVAENGECLISFSDETLLPIKGTASLALKNTSQNGEKRTERIGTNTTESIGDAPSTRFFYVAKPSVSERNAGLDDIEEVTVNDGREKDIDNPFQRGETLRKNFHPTVKPLKLMQYLLRMVTPPNGKVLEIFGGSGTTLIACEREGFHCELSEMNPAYVHLIIERWAGVTGKTAKREDGTPWEYIKDGGD